jgi:serine/threonine protein kinase
MSPRRFRHFKPGERIGRDLTVLGAVAKVRGRHPVYVVWRHGAWCPMACKVFRTAAHAARERAVLQAVAHPNIVRVFGTAPRATLLLEFLEGPTLAAHLDARPRGRLAVADALRCAIHVGAALQHVHAQGYLHLDVKPGNVILAAGRPVLFDFGSARRLGDPRPASVAGTDPYMAPEECRLGEITPAADVFSLGATLFELLSGELPFPEGKRGEPYPQLTCPPARLRSLRPGLPHGLEALVLACLARDPADRPRLPQLLPALHAYVRRGPRMWPDDLRPGEAESPARTRSRSQSRGALPQAA